MLQSASHPSSPTASFTIQHDPRTATTTRHKRARAKRQPPHPRDAAANDRGHEKPERLLPAPPSAGYHREANKAPKCGGIALDLPTPASGP